MKANWQFLFFTILILVGSKSKGLGQEYLEEKASGYKGAFLTELNIVDDVLHFLVMGDWGRNGSFYQTEVAEQMTRASITLDAEFIISTGDNFYPDGEQSVTDPQWKQSFEDIYSSFPLNRTWYAVLGNHDYAGNIQAQIDYSQISRRWNMPAPYFSEQVALEDGKKLLLVFMDSNPFIDDYYEKTGMFQKNLQEQDTAEQRQWLIKTLSDTSSNIAWKIVVGHHPLYSGGKRKDDEDTKGFEQKFPSLFDQHKVDAYLCGHEHDLQIIQPQGAYTTQLLSGSASEIRPTGKREGTIFAAAEPGFMCLSVTPNSLLIQVVNAGGKIIYTTRIDKN